MATGDMVVSSNYGLAYSALIAATLTCCCFAVVAGMRRHAGETAQTLRFMPGGNPEKTPVSERLTAFDQKLTRFIAQKSLTAREQDISKTGVSSKQELINAIEQTRW